MAVPAANICNVARFPTNQEEWNGVSLDTGTDVAVLEAKRGSLADSAGAGVLASLSAPTPSVSRARSARRAASRHPRRRA